MSSHREAIETILKGDATLTGFVADRIYFGRRPAKTAYPYIRFFNVDSVPDILLDGTIVSIDQRWQFDVVDERARGVEQIIDRLLDLLKMTYTSVTVAGPADGTAACVVLNAHPVGYVEALPDPDTGALRSTVDFRFVFKRG